MKSLRLLVLLFGGFLGVASGLWPQRPIQRFIIFDALGHPPRSQPFTPKLLASFSSTDDTGAPPAYGLYDVQEGMLIKRGQIEEELMAGNSTPLKASKPKGVGGPTKGFGGASTGSKNSFQQEAKSHVNVLRKEGVVRIDDVLSLKPADRMREYVFQLREDSLDQVAAATVIQIDRFADVLLPSKRCDLKIPLGESMSDGSKTPVLAALHHGLCRSAVKSVIESLYSQTKQFCTSCRVWSPTVVSRGKSCIRTTQ
jgi:hypothetical protein